MVGVCYLVTDSMGELAAHNRHFHITYEYGVYTVTAAGNGYFLLIYLVIKPHNVNNNTYFARNMWKKCV